MFRLRWTTRMTRAVATIWTAHEALKRGWSSNLCSPWAPLLEVLRVSSESQGAPVHKTQMLESGPYLHYFTFSLHSALIVTWCHMHSANGRGYTCYTSPRQSAFRWTYRLQYASILHSRNLPVVSNFYKSGQIPTLGPWKALRLNRALSPGTRQSMSGLLEKGIFHVYGEIHPLGMLALRIKKEIRLKLCGNLHVLGRYRYLLNPHILLAISRHEKGLKWNVVKKPVKLSHTKPN